MEKQQARRRRADSRYCMDLKNHIQKDDGPIFLCMYGCRIRYLNSAPVKMIFVDLDVACP